MKAKTLAGEVTVPTAWIVTNNQKDKTKPSDRGRKSIKNGKVYLDDKSEFEVELYNPLQECVLCDIKLNGQSISKTGLVLKPAQRFYLDCFIDDKKKFVFNTYEVEDTNETNDSISKNGQLEVFFYKEDVVQINDWRRKFDPIIIREYYPLYYPYRPYWDRPYYSPYPYYGSIGDIYYGSGTGILNSGTTTISTDSSRFTAQPNNVTITGNTGNTLFSTNSTTNYSGSSNNVSALYSNNNSVDVSNLLNNNLNKIDISNFSTKDAEQTINTVLNQYKETGRVEKGTASSQKFDEIDMQFQSFYISSTILQILPNSRKPVETTEIKNDDIIIINFCTSCGNKNNNYTFCPNCGCKLK
jgi:hypothetical protein